MYFTWLILNKLLSLRRNILNITYYTYYMNLKYEITTDKNGKLGNK